MCRLSLPSTQLSGDSCRDSSHFLPVHEETRTRKGRRTRLIPPVSLPFSATACLPVASLRARAQITRAAFASRMFLSNFQVRKNATTFTPRENGLEKMSPTDNASLTLIPQETFFIPQSTQAMPPGKGRLCPFPLERSLHTAL